MANGDKGVACSSVRGSKFFYANTLCLHSSQVSVVQLCAISMHCYPFVGPAAMLGTTDMQLPRKSPPIQWQERICSQLLMKSRKWRKPILIGPHGDYHLGQQSWASKLAEANEGVGPSLLFSMPRPPYSQLLEHHLAKVQGLG